MSDWHCMMHLQWWVLTRRKRNICVGFYDGKSFYSVSGLQSKRCIYDIESRWPHERRSCLCVYFLATDRVTAAAFSSSFQPSNFFSNQKWQIIAQCTHRKVRKMIHSDGLREVFRDFNFRNCENSCHFCFILFASAIMIKAYDSVFGFVFALSLSVLRSDFTAKWVGDFENRKTVIHWSYYQWAIENRYFSFRMAAARNVLFRDSVHSTHRNAIRS